MFKLQPSQDKVRIPLKDKSTLFSTNTPERPSRALLEPVMSVDIIGLSRIIASKRTIGCPS